MANQDAWIPIPTEADVRSQLPPGHPYDFGFFPAIGRLLAAHERLYRPFGALFAELMFAPGALDRRSREMVAAVASAAQDCHY